MCIRDRDTSDRPGSPPIRAAVSHFDLDDLGGGFDVGDETFEEEEEDFLLSAPSPLSATTPGHTIKSPTDPTAAMPQHGGNDGDTARTDSIGIFASGENGGFAKLSRPMPKKAAPTDTHRHADPALEDDPFDDADL
eukprot:TRINITY_DN25050_c0_g1_i1.p1 TRINITY_DN25050_c0_g1~~TRINITY_DN25050_c0_g1_i1.p1  ORF type:complete len:136 (+),score=30.88 TRINITY_DN25050_c0_g1_i1:183-590(+)